MDKLLNPREGVRTNGVAPKKCQNVLDLALRFNLDNKYDVAQRQERSSKC
jgi:hypothetical protein